MDDFERGYDEQGYLKWIKLKDEARLRLFWFLKSPKLLIKENLGVDVSEEKANYLAQFVEKDWPSFFVWFCYCIGKDTELTEEAINWVIGPLKEMMPEFTSVKSIPFSESHFKEFIKAVNSKKITSNMAKEILGRMVGGENIVLVLKDEKYQPTDGNELDSIVKSVILDNVKVVEDIRKGKKQAIGRLIGEVMKRTKGKANAEEARILLEKQI